MVFLALKAYFIILFLNEQVALNILRDIVCKLYAVKHN